MTRSARAAALRSTALATSLALAVGLSAFAVEAAAKPKVPLPKPRPIARNVVPNTTAKSIPRPPPPPPAVPLRRYPLPPRPLWRPRPASLRRCRRRRASRRCRPRSPRRRRPRRPIPRRWKTSSSWCASASRPMRRRRKPRYPIRSRRNSPNGSSCAATTTARRSSAIAPSSRPIRAGPRRPSCAGASRRRCGTTVATTPRSGHGSKTNRRCSAKGKFSLARAMIARGDRANAERLVRSAWRTRFDVRGYRERGARSVRRADHAGRSQGADGFPALRQRARGRAARRQAARRQSGGVGEGAHRRQQQKAANAKALLDAVPQRTAWRSRLHLQQDPAAAPRREIRRGRPADAERAEGSRAGCTIWTNGGSNGGCCRENCSTPAKTATPI